MPETSLLPLGLRHDTGNPILNAHLAKLENYDFELVTRSCAQKYGWSHEKASAVAYQVKQFFALSLLDPGAYHIPEEDVDEYWHRMILHTRWYQQLCDDVFWGIFHHHTPEPDPDLLNEENRIRTRTVANHWFGLDWVNLVKTCTQCKKACLLSRAEIAKTYTPAPEFMPRI